MCMLNIYFVLCFGHTPLRNNNLILPIIVEDKTSKE